MKEQATKSNSRKKGSTTNGRKNPHGTTSAKAIKTKGKSSKKRASRRRLSQKGSATIAVAILVLLVVIVTVASSFSNSNNLTKVTDRLVSCVGTMSVDEVKKSAKVSFYQSASNETVSNLTKFNYVAESSTSTKVCGTKLPKWVAYAKTNKSGNVTQFTLYDFTTIQDSILGVKVDDYVDPSGYTGQPESVLENVGAKPYVTIVEEDGSKTLVYRYYYRDGNSKNDVSIQLTVGVDAHGSVSDVSECSLDFVTGALSYVQ